MWCRKVRNELSAYADRELAPARARAVEEHLAGCEDCRRELHSLTRLVRCATSIPQEEVPAGLHGRILTRLAYATAGPAPVAAAPRPTPSPLFWIFPAFAGAAAAIGLGAFLQNRTIPISALEPARPVQASSPEPRPAAGDQDRPLPHILVEPRRVAEQPEKISAPSDRQAVPPPAPAVVADSAPPAPAGKARLASKVVPPARPQDRSVTPDPAVQPVAAAPVPDRSEGTPRLPEPAPTGMTQMMPPSMPGEPLMNSTGGVQPEAPAPGTPEPGTRMAGMSMVGMTVESDIPAPEDEGLRQLQTFLEERNKTVPQPPVVSPKRDKKPKKS
ncbi:MAG TPA: zf-HC2 domain-containing protein [Armatimonadota bacterium]|nr:zf-HC2 domain-containing protein [Armatimonadota bacterium]